MKTAADTELASGSGRRLDGHGGRAAIAARIGSIALVAALSSSNATGQDFSRVPGVVINYQQSPTPQERQLRINEVYIASPSITIMPNGDYIASHDLFGSGTNQDTTRIFRSTDKGATWTAMATIVGQFWSTVFEHQGALCLFGYSEGGSTGDIVIRKSTDGGASWTTPTSPATGLLREGTFGGTPNSPVVHSGRLWIGQSGSRVMSAPIGADLLQANSWTLSNTAKNWGAEFFGSQWQGWSEGQIVGSPELGVVLLPKVGGLPYTGLVLVHLQSGNVIFNPNDGFVSLPGGEKKFGAVYDEGSGKFFVLSNPVLPVHADDPIVGQSPALIRNTAAVLSSTDLRNWDVEKIFLYSPNLDDGTFGEAFQYLNFAIDDNDLAVVSRTAFDVGDGHNRPPRGHDSNLMTFHRISDFRSLSPDHVLVVDTNNDRVLRYEITQHERAPLGTFTLGSTFDGAALKRPVALAQSESGDTYIQEEGGRILRFDAAGNFIDTVASAPGITFDGPELSVVQPPAGHRTWINSDSGNWFDPTNWYYWGRPDTSNEVAIFGSAIDGNRTVTVNDSFTVKGLRFRNSHTYTLEGSGQITIESTSGDGVVDVELGDHEIRVDVKLRSDTTANVTDNARLRFRNNFDLNGRTFKLAGTGQIHVHDRFTMDGGTLVVNGQAVLSLDDTADATLNGTIQLVLDEGVMPLAGQQFELLHGVDLVDGTFEEVLLPILSGGLFWDTSSLYVDGVVAVAGVLGDYDRSGIVDAADYTAWRDGLGGGWDMADYHLWKQNFGVAAGAAMAGGFSSHAAVPEPASLLLVAMATPLALGMYGRHRCTLCSEKRGQAFRIVPPRADRP